MIKINEQEQRGFTLIEMIIVIAVMGILAAVLIPSLRQMTIKAKVITDIRSIQIIQRQLDLYRAEHRDQYPTLDGDKEQKPSSTGDVIEGLAKSHYITIKNPNEKILSKKLGMHLGSAIVWDDDRSDNLAVGKVEEGQNNNSSSINRVLEGLADGTHKEWINVSLP